LHWRDRSGRLAAGEAARPRQIRKRNRCCVDCKYAMALRNMAGVRKRYKFESKSFEIVHTRHDIN